MAGYLLSDHAVVTRILSHFVFLSTDNFHLFADLSGRFDLWQIAKIDHSYVTQICIAALYVAHLLTPLPVDGLLWESVQSWLLSKHLVFWLASSIFSRIIHFLLHTILTIRISRNGCLLNHWLDSEGLDGCAQRLLVGILSSSLRAHHIHTVLD